MDWTLINWQPQIGDPNFMGWFTVFAYLGCSALSFSVYRCSHRLSIKHSRRQGFLWLFIAITMLFLAINKQLDLQSLFTDIGRVVSKQQGWYETRHRVQKLFIFAAMGFGTLVSAALFYIYRNTLARNGLAILGMCFVLVFVVARAASFHGMDALLRSDFYGIRMNWVLELWGLLLITVNALKLIKSAPSNP